MRLLLIPIVLLLAAAPASSQRHPVPEATPAGDPVDCISLTQVRETRVRSDRVIDFYVTGKRVYRNTLDYDCPQLGSEERFLHKTTIGQYCSTDIITVLRSPGLGHGASCGLGKFQPVTLAETAK